MEFDNDELLYGNTFYTNEDDTRNNITEIDKNDTRNDDLEIEKPKKEELFCKIDFTELAEFGYESKLGKSLKNTLHKFDKDELFEELRESIRYYTTIAGNIPYEKRIKAIQSCELKYSKYYPNIQVEKAFNDILGLRITIETYDIFDKIDIPAGVKVADMRFGKAKDDGYRGIHIYIQKDHFRYPIEIQFVTERDKQFNAWLHDNTYKYISDIEIGKYLRKLYDCDKIRNIEDFRKELKKCVT